MLLLHRSDRPLLSSLSPFSVSCFLQTPDNKRSRPTRRTDTHHTTQLTSNSLLTLALRRLQSSAAGPKETSKLALFPFGTWSAFFSFRKHQSTPQPGQDSQSRTRNNRIIEAANLLLRQTPPFPSSLSSPLPVLPRAGPCRTVQVLFLYPLRRPRRRLVLCCCSRYVLDSRSLLWLIVPHGILTWAAFKCP
ncbi:uncharacterized protein PODANS_1_20910 [Podospora anserina S mat+]|uniref:Podospora anserina S mat+ genomic DNA chromosome 1, supercontig 5 n=1 Tax=Podospora anserina (strain S / ATCC MYA-4624 / DSM 980 / FGSC 10383) TaxID=515849 RepID=B2ABF4_PODAN|nr:uncharacterized protein PODANS_1_20910 [Podospora anserina S mat+]CAP60820.1 unnamed protein product [Podospora anserina S mat+]CDP24483.1 Putative protein of unknown function [Podospora anserina S mat+]